MTIANEISRLQQAKGDMKTAIKNKGVMVAENDKLNVYAAKIEQISTGEEEAAAVQANLDAHTGNTTVHLTAAERNSWNAKETPEGAQAKANAVLGQIPLKATQDDVVNPVDDDKYMTPATTKLLVDQTFLNPPIDTSNALTGNQSITETNVNYDYLFESGKTYNITIVAAGGDGGSPSAMLIGGTTNEYYNIKKAGGGGGGGAGAILTNYSPTKTQLVSILVSSNGTVTLNDEYNSTLVLGAGSNGGGGYGGSGGKATLQVNKAAPILKEFVTYSGSEGTDAISKGGYGGDVTLPLTKTNGSSGSPNSSTEAGGGGGDGVLGGDAPSGIGSGGRGSSGGYKISYGGGGGGYGGGGGGGAAYMPEAYYCYKNGIHAGGYGGDSIVKIECE